MQLQMSHCDTTLSVKVVLVKNSLFSSFFPSDFHRLKWPPLPQFCGTVDSQLDVNDIL